MNGGGGAMTKHESSPREPVYRPLGIEVSKATAWLYACLAAIVLVIAMLALPPMGKVRLKFPSDPRRIKMRNIALAILNYRAAHGVYPHDPRGDEYALYAIHPFTWQVTDFDLRADKPRKARWDHLQGKIECGDILYWNEAKPRQIRIDRILLVAGAGEGKGFYCATMDGSVRYLKKGPDDPRTLLGTLVPKE